MIMNNSLQKHITYEFTNKQLRRFFRTEYGTDYMSKAPTKFSKYCFFLI